MFSRLRRHRGDILQPPKNNGVHNSDSDLSAELSHQGRLLSASTNWSALSPYDIDVRGNAFKAIERSRDRCLDPLGLTILHEPQAEPIADIVFVHGLRGTSRKSWAKNRDLNLFWPLEWLPFEPVISSARISTFGYNANFTSPTGHNTTLGISDFAKDLLFHLRFTTRSGGRSLDIGTYPIVFVAHSMGGLVVKKAYVMGQNDVHYKGIVKAISAILFLSTPHRGSNPAETLNRILSAFSFSKQYINELKSNSPTLQELNEQFRSVAEGIEIASFFETRPTAIGPSSVMILQKDSSSLGYPKEISKPLDADHHGVCKFSDQQDPNYESVRDILKYLLERSRPPQTAPQKPDPGDKLSCVQDALNAPASPFDDQEYFAEKRLRGSCEWILTNDDVIDFMNSPDPGPQILWCSGKPGSGKSVMSSFFVNTLQDEEIGCAYYFFRFGDQLKNNITSFLFSIAYQIACFLPEYRRRLLKMFEDGLNVQKSAPRLIWSKLFVSALFKTDLKSPIYILIDALDESESAGLLLKFFADAACSSIPLRFILASRRTPSLNLALDRLSKTVRMRTVTIDSTEHDLRMYVEEEMSLMRGDYFFKQKTIARILAKANGNFLWVHLVVKEILQCHTEDDVENALTNVPGDLEHLYGRIDATLATNLKPADQVIGQKILQWAVCSRYPLTLAELAEALQPDYPKVLDLEHTIQQVCGEFVTVDKKGCITMLHSSAREYLCWNTALTFYISVEKAHQLMFVKCMHALMSLPSTTRTRAAQARERSFMMYAATSWSYHLENSTNWSDNESLLVLGEFFRASSVLGWIYLLARSSRLRVIVDASKALSQFTKVLNRLSSKRSPLNQPFQEKEFVMSWANDLIRIVGKFGSQLVLHPGLIFKHIPAFSPQDSIIHRQFFPDVQNTSLRVAGLNSRIWEDCLSRFAIHGQSLPVSVIALDRHFAILTSDGLVRLYHSATCEEARTFCHGERVLTMNFSSSGDKLVTYGFVKTKVWDVETANHIASIENPERTKAIAVTFKDDDETIVACSDDRQIRTCSLLDAQFCWRIFEDALTERSFHSPQYNSPRRAVFSPDGCSIAVSFRAHPLAVWSLQHPTGLIALCERTGPHDTPGKLGPSKFTDAQKFCWNPMTGHILGTFNDGCVFKWLPDDHSLLVSSIRANDICCSADGKLFATASGNGSLRIWNFHHFAPIYQLNYAAIVTHLCFDRNENRIYDIREKFCNVWEPNALVSLLDVEENFSDPGSAKESTQMSMAPDVAVEALEPITALSLSADQDRFVTGNDDGVSYVYGVTGGRLAELSERFMTVEHIAWSGDGRLVASSDLSRSLVVEELHENSGLCNVTTLFTSTFQDSIEQILLNDDGSRVLVSTRSAIHISHVAAGATISQSRKMGHYRWSLDPVDKDYIIGFGCGAAILCSWDTPNSVTVKQLDLTQARAEEETEEHGTMKRRPSNAYPMSPSEIESLVTKVLVTVDGTVALLETSNTTFHGKRKRNWLLIHLGAIKDEASTQIVPNNIPHGLRSQLQIPLGFIYTDSGGLSHQRSSSQVEVVAQTKHCLAFISRDFWVCTCLLSDDRSTRVRKHFFLPRDWLSMDSLELATITREGTFLCPRNGEVAIVSGGLAEEWVD